MWIIARLSRRSRNLMGSRISRSKCWRSIRSRMRRGWLSALFVRIARTEILIFLVISAIRISSQRFWSRRLLSSSLAAVVTTFMRTASTNPIREISESGIPVSSVNPSATSSSQTCRAPKPQHSRAQSNRSSNAQSPSSRTSEESTPSSTRTEQS